MNKRYGIILFLHSLEPLKCYLCTVFRGQGVETEAGIFLGMCHPAGHHQAL